MKLRLATVSAIISLLATLGVWATVRPVHETLFSVIHSSAPQLDAAASSMRAVVPSLMLLDVAVIGGAVFLLLLFTVGLPVSRAEDAVRQIATEELNVVPESGPVLARLGSVLRRLGRSLNDERERNRQQLDELRRANEQLVRLQTELVANDRLATVGKLAAGVAHEVGNPLAGILGYLSVLRLRAGTDETVADVTGRIEAEVQRIDVIVRSLLELGRPSRGQAEPLDLRPLIEGAVKLLRASSELHALDVRIDAPASFYARAEAGPLSQVLVNLLLNAGQAMGGQGSVTVTCREEAGLAKVSVDDEGPGIPPEVMPRLFELFFTTKPAGKGSGLGLAVSKHLLRHFGGDLVAENRTPRGARFTITLTLP